MSYPQGIGEQEVFLQQNQSGTNQFDVKKLLFKLIGALPWVVICLAISIFIANLYIRYTPKLYKISANLLIKDEEQSSYKQLKDLGILPGNLDVGNQINILKSYTLSERVVDSLKLNIQIKQEGRVTTSEIYGKQRPFTINVLNKADETLPCNYHIKLQKEDFILNGPNVNKSFYYGDTVEVQYGKIIIERNRSVKAGPKGYQLFFNSKKAEATSLQGKISVYQVSEHGGILEVAMNDEIPERGINIIDKLMEVYNEAGLADKNTVANKTIDFLNDKLLNVSSQLDSLEQAYQTFKALNKFVSIEQTGSLFSESMCLLKKIKIYCFYKSSSWNLLNHL